MNGDKLEYLYNLRPNGLNYDASSIVKRVNGKLVYYSLNGCQERLKMNGFL